MVPDLQVMGNIWKDTLQPPNIMFGLNLGVTVPVFNRNQGNVDAAVGQLRVVQAEVVRLELSLRDRLAEAFRRYESCANQVDMFEQTILPTAEENLSVTLVAYEAGQFDFLRVLTARRSLFESNMDYVTALTELHTAFIEIDGLLLTGGLDSVDFSPIPSNQSGQTSGPGN